MADVKLIPIHLTAGKALVFNIDDVERLRSLEVGGVLTGTLPTAPQQNIFLGLPLQLMVEEVIWLVESGFAYLIPNQKFIDDLITDLSLEDLRSWQKSRYDAFKLQKEQKQQDLILKHNALVSKNPKISSRSITPNDSLISQALFINISDTPESLSNFELFQSIYRNNKALQLNLLNSLKFNRLEYSVFKYLKNKNYFLAPGLRFGGKFIAYPGDPLRYHAHLVVNTVEYNDDIGLMNIVSGGRLATGVKKIWLIGSEVEDQPKEQGDNDDNDNDDYETAESDDKETVCFSVEWAGFG